MARPAWLKRRNPDAPMLKKEREQAAINATGRALAKLDARLAECGADGLADWLRANLAGEPATTRACCLVRISGKCYGRDVMDACRDVMS